MFDLDNTLYSESTGMERDVLRRINAYVSDFLGLPIEESVALRREGIKRFGTTLEWLVYEKNFRDIDDYFSYIHPEGEEDCLEPDPATRDMLESIPLPKIVLTNAPIEHAARVLAKLGMSGCFSALFDIRYNNLVGKPHPDAYSRALGASGLSVASTLFIDDHPKYVRGYLNLGGPAILKDEMDRFADLGIQRVRTLLELPGALAGRECGKAAVS